MKATEAIVKADGLRPNKFSDEQKYDWLMNFEGEVAEVTGNSVPKKTFPGMEHGLLMAYPHDNIYPLYLACVIDYYNQETDLYQNDTVIFEEAKRKAFSHFRRNNVPQTSGDGFKVM